MPTQADYDRLGGYRAWKDFTLEAFRMETETQMKAFELIAGFQERRFDLFICGPAGTGKTHLATAAIRANPRGRVVKPMRILRDARPDRLGDERAIEFYSQYPALVVDDLGAEKGTDFSFATLYEIIDARYMAMRHGLIITSNLELDALAGKLGDDRLSSRLFSMCKVIRLDGNDMRAAA